MADDKRLERIEAKVDDISDHLGAIDVTLKAQHISLREHIRRTELLEKNLYPIHKDIYMAKGALAFIALLSLILGVLQYFKK